MSTVRCRWRWCPPRHLITLRKPYGILGSCLLVGLLLNSRNPQHTHPNPPVRNFISEAEDSLKWVPNARVLYTFLHEVLMETEPESACFSRARVGGWCALCKLDSAVDAAELSWFGGSDGGKALCLDLLLGNATAPCRVISVGINNDFSFDRAAARLGCRVDAFDPTMARPGGWAAPGVLFHPVGVAAAAGSAPLGSGWRAPLEPLSGLLSLAGIDAGPVHVLKLDVESSEWRVLEALLARGGGALQRVRQLAVELHLDQWQPLLEGRQKPGLSEMNARRFLRVLLALRLAGFRLVDTMPYKITCAQVLSDLCIPFIFETLWINTEPTDE